MGCGPWKFWPHLDNLDPLTIRSNTNIQTKLVAKMQHLSIKTYNNEQVAKVFS